MKKIMMVLAAVALAASAQASAFKWQISSMNKVYGADTTTLLASGSAYLFCAESYAQNTLLDDFAAGQIKTDKAVANTTIAAGKITDKEFSYGSDGDANKFYMAVLADDNVYVSALVNGAGQQGKTTAVSTTGANSKLAAAEWTTGSTFSAAGWYTAVPEPTSGLLMLLGMAGLALRRRRA